MLYEQAKVVKRYNSELIWVETQIKTSCNACQHNTECGTGLIAKTLAPKTNRVLVACKHAVDPGQTVTIAVPEQSIVMGSLLLYGVPLASFLLGLILVQSWVSNELISLLLAALFGWAGFYLVNQLSHQSSQKNSLPHVVEQINAQSFVCVEPQKKP